MTLHKMVHLSVMDWKPQTPEISRGRIVVIDQARHRTLELFGIGTNETPGSAMLFAVSFFTRDAHL